MNRDDIELKFYDVLKGNLSILEFEKWIYGIDEELLDIQFGKVFYFEVASLNFKSKYVNKLICI